MKKHKLLFLGVALAAMPFAASADDMFDSTQYDGKTHTRSDRVFTSFTLNNTDNSLGDTKFNVNQPTGTAQKNVYKDLTDATPFVTTPGATVNFSEFTWNGIWMHGYLYIDVDGDKGFNTYLNDVNYPTTTTDGQPLPEGFDVLQAPSGKAGDIMSFSCYNIGTTDDNYVNSKGDPANPGVQITKDLMPGFVIPSNIEAGPHLALLKIDWSSLDQHSNPDPGNKIETNGGCAVLFYVNIVTDRTITIASNNEKYGSVAFQGEDNSVYEKPFPAGQTAVVVATPNEGYFFLNWTKDGKVVSTDATYTVDITDKEFKLVANFVDPDHRPFIKEEVTDKYTRNGGGRKLTSFTLADNAGNTQQYNVNQVETLNSSLVYDITENGEKLTTQAGATINISAINNTGEWVHAFLYIDYDGDGGFNSKLNNTNRTLDAELERLEDFNTALRPAVDGELVSFWLYNIDTTGIDDEDHRYFVDSNGKRYKDGDRGTALTTQSTKGLMPSFTIPTYLKPGTYRALFKTDWSDIDQFGNHSAGNEIGGNGGCFALFTIEIANNTPHVEWDETEDEVYELDDIYYDAAHVTLKYTPKNFTEGEHFIQVYAEKIDETPAESAPAYRTMARAAAGDDANGHKDCIYPDNFGQDDNETLVFTIPNNASNPTLHFAPDTGTDGYSENTNYTYNVTVKTFNKKTGNELSATTPKEISFTTIPNDGETSGVVDIEEAATVAPHYYNLQGIEVAQPTSAGIYIVRQGNKVSKVYVK